MISAGIANSKEQVSAPSGDYMFMNSFSLAYLFVWIALVWGLTLFMRFPSHGESGNQ